MYTRKARTSTCKSVAILSLTQVILRLKFARWKLTDAQSCLSCDCVCCWEALTLLLSFMQSMAIWLHLRPSYGSLGKAKLYSHLRRQSRETSSSPVCCCTPTWFLCIADHLWATQRHDHWHCLLTSWLRSNSHQCGITSKSLSSGPSSRTRLYVTTLAERAYRGETLHCKAG